MSVCLNAEKHSSLLNKVHRNSARKMTRTVQLQAWRVHCPINASTINFVTVLISNGSRTKCSPCNSVCNHTSYNDKMNVFATN